MAKQTKKYGWYSAKGAALAGSHLYEKPDGSTVEVFEINESPNIPSSNWPDIECVGEVTNWIKQLTARSYEYE